MKHTQAVVLLLLCCAAIGCSTDPLIVAHRGASHAAPENTLPAFELAWDRGADAVEGDFRLTRDGHIVCVHDNDMKRVAGTQHVVHASTLDELRALDVGAYRGDAFQGVGVPTIDQVFQTVPYGKKIFVEVKCGPDIVPPLLSAIAQSGLEDDQVVVISFNASVIQALKAAAPRFKAYWLVGFKRDDAGRIVPPRETVLATLETCHADGIDSNRHIPIPLAQDLMGQGYEWHIWTIDEADVAKRFSGLGVDSITTNVPGKLVGVFAETPATEEPAQIQ